MTENIDQFISIFIKFFFLLTPFFAMTMFLSLTKDLGRSERRKKAINVTIAVIIICLILYFLGNAIFKVFGITLDSFRIGAGSLLFISAVNLVFNEPKEVQGNASRGTTVVPLATPITVGPATIGMLLVMGADITDTTQKMIGLAALLSASIAVGILLVMSAYIEKLIGRTGLSIMTKITGLVLSALAAQIVFTGIRNFL